MPVIKTFISALTVAALAPVAHALPPSSAPSEDDIANMVVPPPLDSNYPLPSGEAKPDLPYENTKACVVSGDQNTLEEESWAQDRLRFDDIAQFGVTGSGQKVAVIDTGVSDHDFLAGRLEGGGDYVTDKNGLEDCDGHGTQVAGIIAANPNSDEVGFRGIAPGAGIVSIRQSSGNYEGQEPGATSKRNAGTLQTLASAIRRAADTQGVTVINMSVDNCRLVSDGPITEPERQVQAALRYAVEQRKIVPVASAGNRNDQTKCKEQNSADPKNPTMLVLPPWFSEYVLSVAAVDKNGDPAEFSMQGSWVSVAAPGTEIISLDPTDRTALTNQTTVDGKDLRIEGTSFAAPYVAGLVALVRERFPHLDADAVMNRIKTTAAHPAANGGRNLQVGYGMIDPVSALTASIPAEEGIPADEAVAVPFEMPPAYERDWTPMTVAMIGGGGGVVLLLLTLFVVHTVRRNRKTQ